VAALARAVDWKAGGGSLAFETKLKAGISFGKDEVALLDRLVPAFAALEGTQHGCLCAKSKRGAHSACGHEHQYGIHGVVLYCPEVLRRRTW
jgi:hypothetical protein